MGCVLTRHGGKHDWYTNQKTKQSQPVPRHTEINENLAKSIFEEIGQGLI
jgi:mRNA interferase HicA